MALEKSGFGFAHDVKKQGHESSSFPILCETCLGDNPYVRMLRDSVGKECHICSRPYTVFRWKAGTKGRYKNTVVCQQCSKLKNVCQCCIFDLEYGLPVQVRDKFIAEASKIDIPTSSVNREYFVNSLTDDMYYNHNQPQLSLPSSSALAASSAGPQEALALSSGTSSVLNNEFEAHEQLRKIGRFQPYYKRNLARECSFFARGECKRGDECPFRHYTIHSDLSLNKQGMRERFMGTDDVLAEKILKTTAAGSQTSALDARRKTPPMDKSIKTLVLFNVVTPRVSEQDLRERCQKFGEIRSIKIIPKNSQAFITFATRQAAERAVGFRPLYPRDDVGAISTDTAASASNASNTSSASNASNTSSASNSSNTSSASNTFDASDTPNGSDTSNASKTGNSSSTTPSNSSSSPNTSNEDGEENSSEAVGGNERVYASIVDEEINGVKLRVDWGRTSARSPHTHEGPQPETSSTSAGTPEGDVFVPPPYPQRVPLMKMLGPPQHHHHQHHYHQQQQQQQLQQPQNQHHQSHHQSLYQPHHQSHHQPQYHHYQPPYHHHQQQQHHHHQFQYGHPYASHPPHQKNPALFAGIQGPQSMYSSMNPRDAEGR